jgi:hypothetical protein
MADVFAARGLQRLSVEDYRKDYQLFLDDRCVVARTFGRAAAEFRAMPAVEVDTMRKLLTGRQLVYFRAAERTLRNDRKKPLKQALAEFFDACWAAGLRDDVKELLDSVRADAPPPPDDSSPSQTDKPETEERSPWGTSFLQLPK